MAPTLCSPLKGQRSESMGQLPSQRLPCQSCCNTPMDDLLSLGPSDLLWETSSKGREGQSEDLQK